MAFECLFHSTDTGDDYELRPLYPGNYTAIIDYAGYVLVGYCFMHDLGGLAYILDSSEVSIDGNKAIGFTPDLLDDDAATVIPPGGVFYHRMVDEDGDNGLAILRYTVPFTQSNN